VIRAAAATAVVLGLALAPSAGAATPALTADPQLVPRFRTHTPAYTVRCAGHGRTRFRVRPPAGVRVAFGSGKAHAKPFTKSVELSPGEGVRLHFERDRVRSYDVRCLPADFPSWQTKLPGTPQARWYVVTPSRNNQRPAYVIVFDRHGVPVWWRRGDPPPFNAELLPDGNLAWTRWVFARDPSGFYEVRDLAGRLVRTYRTVGIDANPHELKVLPDGSALLVAYRPRDGVDLRPWGGPPDATVLDGEVQRFDPSGELVWTWSTADHVRLSESTRWLPHQVEHPVDLPDGRRAYDIAHLNSIDVSGDRVLVSLRHADAVYEVDGRDGHVIWKLGGTHTPASLAVTGDPYGARTFRGQHDARYLDARTVSVFDNGVRHVRPPRVVQFRLNRARDSARLERAFGYGPAYAASCCGSARRLTGGDWVVSWGNSPFVGEFTAGGKPVLVLRFGGDLRSYRAFPVERGLMSRTALRRGMDAMAP
jgi:Arylsulfotransferase (ASST)